MTAHKITHEITLIFVLCVAGSYLSLPECYLLILSFCKINNVVSKHEEPTLQSIEFINLLEEERVHLLHLPVRVNVCLDVLQRETTCHWGTTWKARVI